MDIRLGQHFLDRNKQWGMAKGKTLPLVDVCYATNPSPGFDLQSSLTRLSADCDLLWAAGVFSRPYFRVDFSPDRPFGGAEQMRAVADAMKWWTGAERAQLTIIVGNEPNLYNIQPEEVATAVTQATVLRNILGYSVKIAAPAIAPWNPNNVADPADFYPSPRGNSTEWENHAWGLSNRLRGVNYDVQALHAYGRPLNIFDRDEPHRRTNFDSRGGANGFQVYRDFIAAHKIGGFGGQFAITETNTFTDRPSSQSYPYGWMQEATKEAGGIDLVWFVGEPHGVGWAEESLKLRRGQMAAADDDFNEIIRS
jgi:hypothetical protein